MDNREPVLDKLSFSQFLNTFKRDQEFKDEDIKETKLVATKENNNDPFFYINNDGMPHELCDKIINLFENDNNKRRGVSGKFRSIELKIKNTLDLNISGYDEWKEIDIQVYNIMQDLLMSYIKNLLLYNKEFDFLFKDNIVFDNGFQVQKYQKNFGKYIWHADCLNDDCSSRIIAFIWYLNDVDIGGETMFSSFKVKPEKGKLVIFPSTWTYLHKAEIPISNDKYILTGWISIPS